MRGDVGNRGYALSGYVWLPGRLMLFNLSRYLQREGTDKSLSYMIANKIHDYELNNICIPLTQFTKGLHHPLHFLCLNLLRFSLDLLGICTDFLLLTAQPVTLGQFTHRVSQRL